MDKLTKFIKKYKYLVGIPLAVLWFLGFICLVNSIFTWWAFVGITVFWTINVLGWIEIVRRYT